MALTATFASQLWQRATSLNHRFDKRGNPMPMELHGCGCGLCAKQQRELRQFWEARWVFIGTYRVRVDDKGRLAIPAAFRKQLPEGSFVSLGLDAVLAIYPPDLWASLAENLLSPLQGPDQRALARTLYSLSEAFEPDGQGRIILRPEQRKLAEIGSPSSVVVIGSGSRVEIWQEARWDSYSADAQGRFTESADRVISARWARTNPHFHKR
jgi:MraZ protein